MIADEYIIATQSGEDYPFDKRGLDQYLSPEGFDVEVVPPEYGQLGLIINGFEFSFCIEPVGLQVAIEDGEPTENELSDIFNAIIDKLKSTTGLDGTFYPI